MSITIVGWTSDDKVPAVIGETKFGQGRIEVGSQPWYCLVTGNKTSTGSATADQDIDRVYSEDDADSLYGPGSEIACQCYAALLVPGVALYGAPVAEASGTQATLTITIGGSWTASGSLAFWIGRWYIEVSTGADVQATANAIAAAVNAKSHCFCTAAVGAGPGYVVTLTVRVDGPRGNDYYVKKIEKNMPTGMTCTLAGGTPTGSGLVPFSAGATADTPANVIALLKSQEYDLIAPAQYEAVGVALWEAHVDSEGGPLIGHLEHLVVGHNGSSANAITLAQTTLNAYRAQLVWSRYNLAHPNEIAACWAAYRSVVEQTNPNPNYDDVVIPVCVAQEAADIPTHAEKKAALNAGVSPLTTKNGAGVMVRSIVTHCLDGATPDYRCLDTTDASVPDRIRKELVSLGEAWKQQNPYVQDDVDDDEERPAEGVGTPSMWQETVYAELKRREKDKWITAVDDNLPSAEWDSAAKRIMSAAPVVPMPKNHQIGVSVRQLAS